MKTTTKSAKTLAVKRRSIKRYLAGLVSVQLFLLLATASALAQESELDGEPFSQAELDQMLAPVALYPDSVLSQLLIASTYPLEVVMAERWTRDNPELKGQEAVDAVEVENWDPSVKALVAFPDLLRRMSEDLDWTESLGETFLADEEQVLESVQDLRQRAYDTGTLEDLEHLAISRDANRQIIIEPVVREVVYIPYYDTRVVYGPWWWANHQPYHWHDHHHRHWVHWGPSVHISGHFFFSAFRWDHRRVVVIDRGYRYRQPLYRSHYIARHQHARHWQHNPQHRRGVKYRNPRTRDFFEARHRLRRDDSRYRSNIRGDSKQQIHPQRRPSQEAIKRSLNRDANGQARANRVRPSDKQYLRQRSGDDRAGKTRITAGDIRARERATEQQRSLSDRQSGNSRARELRK